MTPEERAVIDAAKNYVDFLNSHSISPDEIKFIMEIENAVEALEAATSRQQEPATSDGDTGCPVSGNASIVPEGYWVAKKRPIDELPMDGFYLIVATHERTPHVTRNVTFWNESSSAWVINGIRFPEHPKDIGYTHFYELPKGVEG